MHCKYHFSLQTNIVIKNLNLSMPTKINDIIAIMSIQIYKQILIKISIHDYKYAFFFL